MELKTTGTNTEITPPVQRYIERKLGKLSRHLPTVIDAKVELSEEQTKSPQQRFLVRVTVTGGVGGAVFHGEERGEDPFEAVDKVSDVMTRQLERHKGKLYDKGRGSSLARSDYAESAPPAATIVKRKRFVLVAMTSAEAIEQMEELGHSFFLFLDADSDEVKLIYRRNDGSYGLIEPEVG